MDPALAAAGPDGSIASKCEPLTCRSNSHSTLIADPPSSKAETPLRDEDTRAKTKADRLSACGIKTRDNHGWRRIIRNFTPSWFSVNMGTGIVSILLHNLPYNGAWLYRLSIVVFVLNTALYLLFLAFTVLRYALWPELFWPMIRHPHQSLFLGTIPVGLATILNMIVLVCVPAWGERWLRLAWGLWWIDVFLSFAACFFLPFVIIYFHKSSLRTMTAIWLLPVVSTVVAAALPNPQHALITLIVSYVLWGTGVPLALIVLVMYFQRLTIHHLPPREIIVSVFIPLGPFGQGGFAIMALGRVALETLPQTGSLMTSSSSAATTAAAGEILYVVGFLTGLVMWAFGLVWLFLAAASISRGSFPFNIGWWGFTFPLGVYAVATTTLGREMPSRFFNVLGTVFSVMVMILWIVVATETLRRALSGELFYAPCLKALEEKEEAERTFFKESHTV